MLKEIRYSLNVIETEKPSLAKSQVERYPEKELKKAFRLIPSHL
jgi:hypothetical protein